MFDENSKATIISTFDQENRVDTKVMPEKQRNEVEGIIFDECGCKIEKACVKVLTSDYEPLIHTVSNANGEFVLIYEYSKEVVLIISKDGYKTLVIENFCREIEITLVRVKNSATLTGRLTMNNCGEIISARVRLNNNKVKLQVFPDSDGFFIINDIPCGCYRLIVDGNELKKTVMSINISNSIRIYNLGVIKIDRINIKGTIHGIITDCDNLPINNAVVILYNSDNKLAVSKTHTNSEGLYFFGNVELGKYNVMAFQ